MHLRMDVGTEISRDAPEEVRRRAADDHLSTLPDAIWVWSDGSAEGGVTVGGSKAMVVLPSGGEIEL